jgi:hypothetical protein
MTRGKSSTRAAYWAVWIVAAIVPFGIAACSDEKTHKPSIVDTSIIMPDLVGKSWGEAGPELRKSGWIGLIVREPDVAVGPTGRQRIVSQSPPAGERVESDVQITIRFGV